MAKPVLKWAGGKRQILTQILGCFPPESEISSYHEPFFGGGAIFFKEAYPYTSTINDINKRLMNFYEVVRDYPGELIEVLESFDPPSSEPRPDREFSETNRKGKEIKNYYYQQREHFNKRPNDEDFDRIEEAALLLYLNRTCYNGLYRENSSGEFNVPIGSASNPNWLHESRIHAASSALEGVKIWNDDFAYILDEAEEGDLVYFDPPYEPRENASSFVEYHSEDFGQEEQQRLCDVAVKLSERGVDVVISNSPPMEDLYQGLEEFYVDPVGARRAINSNAEERGEVKEILVTTVDPASRRRKDTSLEQFAQEEAE